MRVRVRARTRVAGAAAAVALAVMVAACSSGSSSGSSGGAASGSASGGSPGSNGKSVYTVGSIIDLTGNDAASGAAEQAGMGFFLQQLNAGGGIDGHQLKVTYCDAASTPQGAAQCAQQFAGLPTHVVLIQSDDPPTRGALPYLTKDLVLVIDPVLLPKSGTNAFQATSSGKVIAAALVSAVKSSGLSSIGVLYTTDTSGTAQLGAAEAAAKAAGISVVSQPQTPGVTDVTPQLLKLKSMGAQVFYLASVGANTAAAVSSYKTLGLTIPVVTGAASVTNSFLKSLPGGIPANLYGVSQLVGDTGSLPSAEAQAWTAFKAAFAKYAGQPIDTQTLSAQYLGCVVKAVLASSPSFSVSAMEHFLETSAIPCLGVQERYNVPGLNVPSGQPAAVTKAGATAADGWGAYQGKL